MPPAAASVGVADHCGWAVLVTVGPGGRVLDRRQVDLVDEGLPKLPHHHDAQGLPLDEAVALIERVRASADRNAALHLEALAAALAQPIRAIALRRCPPLPPTIAERLTDYRAQNVADSVLCRDALADAARARGWAVEWYERASVGEEAAAALKVPRIEGLLRETGRALGSPWRQDHKVA